MSIEIKEAEAAAAQTAQISPPQEGAVLDRIKYFFKHIPRNARIAAAATAAVVVVGISASGFALGYDGIYSGVSFLGTPLGGMSQDEVTAAAKHATEDAFHGRELLLKSDSGASMIIRMEDADLRFNGERVYETAAAYGKEGGAFSRLGQIISASFSGAEIEVTPETDMEYLREQVTSFSAQISREPLDYTYRVEGDELIIKSGQSGMSIDEGALLETIGSRLTSGDLSAIQVSEQEAPTKSIDLKAIRDEIYQPPKDAALEKQDGNEYGVTPHERGIDFIPGDYEEMLLTPQDEYIIPLIIAEPEVTESDLAQYLFKDLLATSTTTFSESKYNRSENIRLATSFIDGLILAPGEEFSYNGTVGPRTAERGFLMAAVFEQGAVVDGIGGGICQVSSTLYMAALRANLEIVERRNHQFVVGYTPIGQDATVSYGSTDFRFKNNTHYPIRLSASAQSGTMKVDIYGTKTDEVVVELRHTERGSSDFTTKYVEDKSVAPGSEVVKQSGLRGRVVEVFQKVTINGEVVKDKSIGISSYIPQTRIVHVNTTPAESSGETPPPTDATTPPADVSTPPADVSTPPADVSTPPAEENAPPPSSPLDNVPEAEANNEL